MGEKISLFQRCATKLCNFALAISGGRLEGTQLECEREAKEILALIAEEVRKVEKEAEETPRAWDGLGKAYQDGWEDACQKVFGLLEGK